MSGAVGISRDFLRPRGACACAPNIVPVVSHRADQTLLTSQTV